MHQVRFSLRTFILLVTIAGLLLVLIATRNDNAQLKERIAVMGGPPFRLEDASAEFERQAHMDGWQFYATEMTYKHSDDSLAVHVEAVNKDPAAVRIQYLLRTTGKNGIYSFRIRAFSKEKVYPYVAVGEQKVVALSARNTAATNNDRGRWTRTNYYMTVSRTNKDYRP